MEEAGFSFLEPMRLNKDFSSSPDHQESDSRQEHDCAGDGGDQEFGAGQVLGTDQFAHGQRDEDVENRARDDQHQDGFCDGIYSAEHGAAAHFPLRHIFAFPFRLPLRGVIDFDAGDYDQDDDYDDEFDHDFFRSRLAFPAGTAFPVMG